MAQTELFIVLKLIDDATAGIKKSVEGVKTNFKKLADSTNKLGTETRLLGREIEHIGSIMTFVGGLTTAVFVKALHDSSSGSSAVRDSLERLSFVTSTFQRELAEAVLPVIERLTNFLSDLLTAFNSISPQLRNQILQFTLMSGIFLTLGGVIDIFIGKIFILGGNILKLSSFLIGLGPVMLGVGVAIGGLIALMFKFEGVAKPVVTTFEIMFNFLKNGFLTLKATFELTISGMLDTLTRFSNVIGKLPSALGVIVKEMGSEISNASNELQKMAQNDLKGVITNTQTIDSLFKNGEGEWSKSFLSIRDAIKQIEDAFGNLNTNIPSKVSQLSMNLETLRKKAEEIRTTLEQGIGQAFGKMIVEGQNFGESLKSLFKSVAEDFIAEVGRMIVKWLEFTALKAIGSFFGFNQGGEVQGFSKGSGMVQGFSQGSPNIMHLASGTDTIPAMLSPGEIVIPKSLSDSIRQGQLSLSGPKEKTQNESNIQINIYYPKFKDESDMNKLGMEIQRQLRYPRG